MLAIGLWVGLLVLLVPTWFIRRETFPLRARVPLALLSGGYVFWVFIAHRDTVGPLWIPVIVVISLIGAFREDIQRLFRRRVSS